MNPARSQPPSLSACHGIIQKVKVIRQQIVCYRCQWPIAIGGFGVLPCVRGSVALFVFLRDA